MNKILFKLTTIDDVELIQYGNGDHNEWCDLSSQTLVLCTVRIRIHMRN